MKIFFVFLYSFDDYVMQRCHKIKIQSSVVGWKNLQQWIADKKTKLENGTEESVNTKTATNADQRYKRCESFLDAARAHIFAS